MNTLQHQLTKEHFIRQEHQDLIKIAANARTVHRLFARKASPAPERIEIKTSLRLRLAYIAAITVLALWLASEVAVAAARLMSISGGSGGFLVR